MTPTTSSRTPKTRWLMVGLVTLGLVCGATAPRWASANTETTVQAVVARMGWDGATHSVTSSINNGSGDAEQTDITQYADDLPIRILTSYRAADRSGTNLEDLTGYSGEVLIRIDVANLNVQTTETSFELGGSKYRQFGLVGAPYTVALSADLKTNDQEQVITNTDSGTATNGIVGQTSEGMARVWWTALLAPPVTNPAASFTLLMDAHDFMPPTIDVIVQPGIVTDLSISALVERAANGGNTTEAAAVDLMLQVQSELVAAQELVEELYATLSQDAQTLGAQTFADLQSSAAATLSGLVQLQSDMVELASRTSSSVTATQATLSAQLRDVFDQLSNEVLGDPSDPVDLTPDVVRGCNITFPQLAPDQPLTVSAVVQLVAKQVEVLQSAFADPAATTPAADNCRAELTAVLRSILGDPSVGCAAADGQADSFWCQLGVARADILTELATAMSIQSVVSGLLATSGIDTLDDQALAMQTILDELLLQLTSSGNPTAVLNAASLALTTVSDGLNQTLAALDSIARIAATQLGVSDPIQAITEELKDLAYGELTCRGLQSVPGLTGASLLAKLQELGAEPGCSYGTLAATVAAAQATWAADQRAWQNVASLAAVDTAALSNAVRQAQTVIGQIAATLTAGGSTSRVGELVGDLYSGVYRVRTTTPTLPCPDVVALPTRPGDALIVLTNQLVCNAVAVDASFSALEVATSDVQTQVNESFNDLAGNVSVAFPMAQGYVDGVSDQLVDSLEAAAGSLADNQAVIDEAGTGLETTHTALNAEREAATAALIAALERQVSESALTADEIRASLAQDFEQLLIDLGNPADTNPTGLLGKLRLSAALTADTANTLALVATGVGSDIFDRTLTLQNSALQQRQLEAGNVILAQTPFLGTAKKPNDQSITLYSIHIGSVS